MKDILIIEDNQELGGLLKDFLIKEGFTVELVDTAEEGMELRKPASVAYEVLRRASLGNRKGERRRNQADTFGPPGSRAGTCAV